MASIASSTDPPPSTGPIVKRPSEIVSKSLVSQSQRWSLEAEFERITSTPPRNDAEAALAASDDKAYWDIMFKLRVDCRTLVKDRFYQFVVLVLMKEGCA